MFSQISNVFPILFLKHTFDFLNSFCFSFGDLFAVPSGLTIMRTTFNLHVSLSSQFLVYSSFFAFVQSWKCHRQSENCQPETKVQRYYILLSYGCISVISLRVIWQRMLDYLLPDEEAYRCHQVDVQPMHTVYTMSLNVKTKTLYRKW